MSRQSPSQPSSPWRGLIEATRRAAGGRRDGDGVKGSINWLRKQMERRGANPNVVRNIIYRDKGRLTDKRVLFEILGELWRASTQTPLQAPEIEVLLAHHDDAERNGTQLLDREKRRTYRTFVDAARSGEHPKLLVSGRPGSGKTLLIDYVQEALESQSPANRLLRLEFSPGNLSPGLVRLATGAGVAREAIESKLAKIAAASAFAVQADAQAEVARLIRDAFLSSEQPLTLLAHVSRFTVGDDHLGGATLRLNTPEVPRVTAPEWLWLSLFDPLSRHARVCLLVSMTDLPASAAMDHGGFTVPVRLSPPTISEARRFVRTRLPLLDAVEQEALVRRAGRSYEGLRTLTLLSEVREPLNAGSDRPAEALNEEHLSRLAALVKNAGDERLRDFLAALATLSLPEFPTFEPSALLAVRDTDQELSPLERSFLDPVPPCSARWRAFSRHFSRLLRHELAGSQPARYRLLNLRAARFYRQSAGEDPGGDCARRYVQHLLLAREWEELTAWLERHGVEQTSIGPLWEAARSELDSGHAIELIARQVASHYVRLGSYHHPHALQAFDVLSNAHSEHLKRWALVRRAEGAVQRGQADLAESLLDQCPTGGDNNLLAAEAALVRASVARWRSESDEAVRLVESVARPQLSGADTKGREGQVALAKAAVWSGLMAKDRCDLDAALHEFSRVTSNDQLVKARVAFQQGDVLITMGRFDAALRSLNSAVLLARQNQALAPEQARYLNRRSKLHRKRGELQSSHADLDSARSVILSAYQDSRDDLERSYRLALCNEERAMTLLAVGDFESAILLLKGSIGSYERYAEHHALDATYRILRTTLRLALAYLCRGRGQPYRLPYLRLFDQFAGGPDLRQARYLHSSAERQLAERNEVTSYWSLRRHSYLLGSLVAEDPVTAVEAARCAVAASRLPYHEAESLSYLASSSLRDNQFSEALEYARQAQAALDTLCTDAEGSDRGLRAWHTCIRMRAQLQAGDGEGAAQDLVRWLDEPHPPSVHEAVLRAFGEALEAHECSGVLGNGSTLGPRLGWTDDPQLSGMRLPDELASRFNTLRADTAEDD